MTAITAYKLNKQTCRFIPVVRVYFVADNQVAIRETKQGLEFKIKQRGKNWPSKWHIAKETSLAIHKRVAQKAGLLDLAAQLELELNEGLF